MRIQGMMLQSSQVRSPINAAPQGAVHTEFRAEVVLAALQLSHLMKPSANMRDVVIAACRMVLDPDSLQDIKRKFDSGNLAVPVYDTLRRWWVKFDCLATLYQRQVDLSSDIVRCLLMDSSPIAGWNYLCSKSLEFRFAKGMTHSARMEACLVTAYQSRRLPVMVLGHGASSVTVKVAELVHIMKMETGTIAAFNLWRWSVRHFCSDQGAERIIERCPNVSGSLREIVDVVSKVQGCEQHLFDSPDAYMFPLALGQPGHLHIVYNSLEHGVKSLKVWSEMEPILRDITNFLGDKGLRRRLAASVYHPVFKSCLAHGLHGTSTGSGSFFRLCVTSFD